MKVKTPKFLKQFRRNRSGLSYIWSVAACSLVFFPLLYWVLSVALDSTATIIFGMYTFSGITLSSWLLVKALISALPVFTILIVLLWSAVNAKASSMEQ